MQCRQDVFHEWFFQCSYDGNIDGFDGVSIIEFDEKGKIKSVKEFQSKSEHIFPYADSTNLDV